MQVSGLAYCCSTHICIIELYQIKRKSGGPKTENAQFCDNCDYIAFCWFLCDLWRAGYGSESEADDEAATVTLVSDLGRVNRASTKSAVKLQEIGPRMTLQLIKIEEGLCSGSVIFSEYGMCILQHVAYKL